MAYRDFRQVWHTGFTDGWNDSREGRRMILSTEKAERQFADHGYRGKGKQHYFWTRGYVDGYKCQPKAKRELYPGQLESHFQQVCSEWESD